jgi:vacuolar protein sorting-associated protein 35
VKKLEGFGKVKDSKATKQIVALLSAPLEKYNDVVTILKLTNYSKVMEHLDYGTNKVMSGVIIQSIMKNNTLITEAEKVANLNNLLNISMLNECANVYIPQVEALFELLREIIIDSEGIPGLDEVSSLSMTRMSATSFYTC